jgi:hypothetical protein
MELFPVVEIELEVTSPDLLEFVEIIEIADKYGAKLAKDSLMKSIVDMSPSSQDLFFVNFILCGFLKHDDARDAAEELDEKTNNLCAHPYMTKQLLDPSPVPLAEMLGLLYKSNPEDGPKHRNAPTLLW